MDERSFLKTILDANEPQNAVAHAKVLVPRGDDAAVVRYGNSAVVLTTDSFIEGRHFSLEYFSPSQVGAKAVEGASSDVLAMGGRPQYLLWSLVFGAPREAATYREIADGVRAACVRLNLVLVGGNVAQGLGTMELTMTVLGELPGARTPVRRGGAAVGDAVMVSGTLGASAAGLMAWRSGTSGFDQIKRAHVAPRCRLDLVDKLGGHASSMIDVSDGLSNELYLLSEASSKQLIVDESKVPLHPEVRRFAAARGEDPYQYAYTGGEDYELLFTLPQSKVGLVPATQIGEVREGSGVLVCRNGAEQPLVRGGFDHLMVR